MKKLILSFLLALAMAASAWASDPAVGVWQAPPDAKGQIGHIRIDPCGSELCATIIRAFDPHGKEIVTHNVGKQILWNMRVQGKGQYGDGRVFVPAHNREYDAKMSLSGRKLSVKGCVGVICKGQVWTRVN